MKCGIRGKAPRFQYVQGKIKGVGVTREIVIKPEDSGRRLDKYLFKYLNKAPVSSIYKLLRKKRIKLNNKKAEGSEIISGGDILQFYLSDETLDNFKESRIIKKGKKIDIIYEDNSILLVNKPSGLLSHSSEKAGEDTMLDRMMYYLYDNGSYSPGKDSTFTPALCNRLDRNTSGIIICGKNIHAVQQLNAAISGGLIEKYYLAVVKGSVGESGVLKGFHVKDGQTNISRITDSERNGSREAVTEFEPVITGVEASLLRIKLVTGRSHQIRVHMNSIGHSVIGDVKYGDEKVNRIFMHRYGVNSQLLHAEKIYFKDIAGELAYISRKEFIAEPPEIFSRIRYNT